MAADGVNGHSAGLKRMRFGLRLLLIFLLSSLAKITSTTATVKTMGHKLQSVRSQEELYL